VIEGVLGTVAGLGTGNARAMLGYLDAYYDGYGQVKAKQAPAKPVLHVNPAQFTQFKELWARLNQDAVLHYELDTPALVDNIVQRLGTDFSVRPLTIQVTRTDKVQSLHNAQSTQTAYEVKSHTVFTLAGFVRELANATKLSYHTVALCLARMPVDKFAQIRHNEGRSLSALRDLMLGCVYELLIHKVSYQLREIKVKTALTDNTGALLQTLNVSLCGVEQHTINNPEVRTRSLYLDDFMPVDSQIERDTVDESHSQRIAVFAKLPKVDIPTPAGKYNPDFGYAVLQGDDAQALYLVVETKGYDNFGDIQTRERGKIESAKRFFEALRQQGTPVAFHTKLNRESLAQIIHQIGL
jgi:type III restriction enzyme